MENKWKFIKEKNHFIKKWKLFSCVFQLYKKYTIFYYTLSKIINNKILKQRGEILWKKQFIRQV